LNSYNRESRSEMRGKRRRTNLILNMLIGLVLLLIIVVSSIIFLGGNDDTASDKKNNEQTENKQDTKDSTSDSDKEKEENKENKSEDDVDKDTGSVDETDQKDENKQDEKSDENETTELNITPADEKEAVVTTGGENDNVKKTIENPSWKPIGTSQTGEHTSVFDKESVDWSEMIQAITYATGVEESNMTIWFLGNNGHNRAVGTISSKDTKEKYRVYIDWADGQGWKPTKVEELNEIENKQE